MRRPQTPTLSPYTTLFRSVRVQHIQKLPVLFYFIVLPGRKTDFGYPYLLFHFEMIQDVSHFLDFLIPSIPLLIKHFGEAMNSDRVYEFQGSVFGHHAEPVGIDRAHSTK